MNLRHTLLIFPLLLGSALQLAAQCGGILEPGFKFLTSSRGCAPFTVNLETFYLSSVPGTVYYIDWGDGSPEQQITQVGATGVTISHNYPNSSVNCGYDLIIDASNACNPRGSVVPINTQVIVWTNDVISIDPQEFRVCQGFAANLQFTDNSQWNCFPRLTRENNEARWIQWIYGTGTAVNQVAGVQVNSQVPGGFPYFDPAPFRNPIHPVLAPGQISLPISVPATLPVDIGKEFVVTLKNWNQCNAYDNSVLDGNAFNPVNGDLLNGDNNAQVITGRIVIVPSPQPTFVTKLGNASGAIQSVFCIGDLIFFDDQTPGIGGASFQYTWEFFDNATGTGTPIGTSTSANPTFIYPLSGQKLIRVSVRDANAAGNCVNTFDRVITISPSLVSKIKVTDLLNNVITPYFCQEASGTLTNFTARFNDASVGLVTPTTQWKWEVYDPSNTLIRQEPAVGFSVVAISSIDQVFTAPGIYHVRLRVRDNVTSCESVDDAEIRVYIKPIPLFAASTACEGKQISFVDGSTLTAINGETISLREWDFNYSGIFTPDAAFTNQTNFTRVFPVAGTFPVALRVTTSQNSCSSIFILPVKVSPLPTASFTPNITSGCGPLAVSFTNNSVLLQLDVIDQFIWEVDDRSGTGFQTVAIQRPTDINFSSTFNYVFPNLTITNKLFDVRLRVRTVNGCEQFSSAQVIIAFPGTASGFSEINYSPFNTNCSPQSISFKVDSQTQSLNPTDYLWTVTDASGTLAQQSTGVIPTFSFPFVNATSSFKDFKVTLTTLLPAGCKGDSTRTIRISPVPISLFILDTLQLDCDLMKIRVSAIQKGLSSYHWVIRENAVTVSDTRSNQDMVEFSFNRLLTGNSPVSIALDTENFANCPSAVTNASLDVPQKDVINTSFTVTPLNQTLPASTVTFTNTTNLGPWTYAWDFGDQTTATSPAITSHTYATYGTYEILLRVKSQFCEEKSTQTVVINAIPPQVDFSFDPPSGCVPLQVTFTNLAKFAEDKTYQWDFGDGTTSQEKNPIHVYSRADSYTVSLSASNITGQRITATKPNSIQVYPRPTAGFDIKPRLIYIPGGTLYTSNLSFDATRFVWDFGDGTFSSNEEPEHQYTTEGVYTIKLKAFNQFDCADSAKLVDVVKVEKGGQVLVPNAFSPSGVGNSSGGAAPGDGKNDVFLPLMRGVTQFELLIFNRWGELLFESSDATRGWDGYYNGKLCQQDVYMYKLTARFENGENVVRVGDINLIR
jgi:gliding motility-associated-like protein